MTRKFHTLRRAAGAVLLLVFVVLPFLQVNGESALRFDIPTLRLLFFGSQTAIADFFVILIALIFITFSTIFITTLFGRIWCGWLCPQTVLCDVTGLMEKSGKRDFAGRVLAVLSGMLVCVVISFSMIGYFVSPYDIPGMLRSGGFAAQIVTGSWLALFVLFYLDLALLRRNFCATVCPYAKLQGVLFDDRTLLVAYDRKRTDECMDCRACVRSCPARIDIRNGTQSECIHCAECVDACTERMAGRGKASLVRYSFGMPGLERPGLRINPLITGIMTGISLFFLLWLSASKMPFDVNVRAYTGAPRQENDGSVTNVYELSFRNLTRSDIELVISIASPYSATISPERIILKRGQDVTRVPSVVTLRNIPDDAPDPMLPLTVRSKAPDRTVSQSVYFMLPESK
jgi:cytochrome c oxidase accessory protein FixG